MKNRGDKDMVCAFDLLIQSLIIRGLKTHLQRLDNEASLALRNYLTKHGINYQLAPSHIHWRKNSERAIQTFKNHFIAGLCSVDPTFPLKFWDKLVNTSGKAGAQIPHLPLGNDSSPWGR
jgi:hypothetical protein